MRLRLKYYSVVLFLTTCHGLCLLPQDSMNSKHELSEKSQVLHNPPTMKSNNYRAAELQVSSKEARNLQREEEKFAAKILVPCNSDHFYY